MSTFHRFHRHALAVCLGLLSFALHAQTVREEAVLLDKPEGKPTNIKLSAGAAVKTVKRQGFWVEVDASGKTGWLKVSQINFAGATGGATAIDTGRLGTGNIVATSAARGLSAKDLLEGRSDEKAVDRLAEWRPESRQLQQFASEGGLTEVRLAAFLQAPRTETTSAAPREATESGGSAAGSRTRRNRKGADEDM